MNCTHMPAGWQPPADAWTGSWNSPATIVMAVFGAQGESLDTADGLHAWLTRATGGAHPPFELCHGEFTDRAGLRNRIAIGYWNSADYARWWSMPGVGDWWSAPARLTASAGYWREVMSAVPQRRETLFSSQTTEGMACAADRLDGPITEHGYWGAARDRMPVSATDPLAGSGQLRVLESDDGKRRRVTGTAGLCVIRSGQDWSACAGAEREHYLGEIRPVLERGMHYLIEQPGDAHCHSCRLIGVTDAHGATQQKSFALAYFPDLRYLEDWAREHATHHAIFDGFLHMVARFEGRLELKLWHEVFVLDSGPAEFEYIGCHAQTGLLAAL